jgi:hypothetical protein
MPDFADTRVSLAGQGHLIARAASTVSSNSCVIDVYGIQVAARVLGSVTINVNDVLMVLRMGSRYFVQDVVAAAPVVPPVAAPPPDTTPSSGDKAPTPKPTVTTGTLTCSPVSTATYRDGSWRSDIGRTDYADLFQGRYSGSSFGRNTGCAFYGSKPRTISGATVTKATIHLRRLKGAGVYSGRTPTLRLLSQSTRPSGAPTLNESTSGPSLAVGDTVNAFAIPNSWAQAMVGGTRGGIAINISSDDPYIQLAGRASWSAAWVLVINWRRG